MAYAIQLTFNVLLGDLQQAQDRVISLAMPRLKPEESCRSTEMNWMNSESWMKDGEWSINVDDVK